ncbi:transcription factor, contains a PHD finger motif, partial [Dimargaris cristalligena]
MSADPPPYDPDSLTWNEAHTTNAEHQYCYCGEDRSILDVCLQCHQCLNWFHERCLRVPLGPIVPLVTNYQLKCRRCVWRAAHPHSPRLAVPPVAPPGSRSEITPPEPMPPTPPLPSLPSPPAATVLQASPAPPPTGDTESPAILTDIPIKSSPPPTAPPSPPKSIGLAAYPTSSPLSTSSLSDLSMASSDDSSDLSSPELDPSLRDDSNIDDIPELPTLDVPTCPTESVPQPQPPSSAPDSEAAKAPTPPLVESPAPLKEISPPNVNRMTISEPAPPPPVVEPPEPAPPLDLFLEVEEEYQRTSAGWKDICATTIANLTLNYLRNHWDPDHLYSAQMETHPLPECYFNKQDIVPFVDANWKALCTFRSRTTTWWATLGSCLYTVNNVFITKDGGRRTAASDFRLMDVNLWNFRPGAIPPRPHRSAGPTALSTTPSAAKPKDSNRAKHSSKTKKRPLDSSTDPAVVEEELLAGPGTGVGAGAGAGAGDAEKAGTTVPIAPNAKAQNKSLSFAKRFAQTIGESPFGLVVPVSGTASGCPTSATSVTSPAANFPPIEVKVEPSRANPKKAPRAEKPSTTNGTGSSYFSTLAIHSPKRTVHYVDPPLDAVNEPGLVYTPCCCALPTPGNSWKTGCPPPGSLLNYYYPSTGPTTSDQPQLRSRALSYQDRNPNLKVTEGGTRVTTTGGFRSIRGVYPITDGQYFIEYFITAAQPGQGLPHVRLGFGLPQ